MGVVGRVVEWCGSRKQVYYRGVTYGWYRTLEVVVLLCT